MRQVICEKNQAPLAPSAVPKAIYKNLPHPNQNNQSEQEEYLTECFFSTISNGKQTTTEQSSNEKTAHPSFVNNSLQDKNK